MITKTGNSKKYQLHAADSLLIPLSFEPSLKYSKISTTPMFPMFQILKGKDQTYARVRKQFTVWVDKIRIHATIIRVVNLFKPQLYEWLPYYWPRGLVFFSLMFETNKKKWHSVFLCKKVFKVWNLILPLRMTATFPIILLSGNCTSKIFIQLLVEILLSKWFGTVTCQPSLKFSLSNSSSLIAGIWTC